MTSLIRFATQNDLEVLSRLYAQCFPRETLNREWITANFAASPRMKYCVYELEGEILAYSLWTVKSGFRDASIVELEQIAVNPTHVCQRIGTALLRDSYALFSEHLNHLGVTIRGVLVTTREGNFAEKMYKEVLGVTERACIENYGSGNELILYRSYA